MQWEADAAAKAGVTVSLLRFAIAFFASTLVGTLDRPFSALVPSVKGALETNYLLLQVISCISHKLGGSY